mmetsp:Transcript_39305/g.85865  ORF Transcript_39305/g.85865 Transcript_39305/m.85865 type:complete len:202 (+) Transcript_39305:240-845(+)
MSWALASVLGPRGGKETCYRQSLLLHDDFPLLRLRMLSLLHAGLDDGAEARSRYMDALLEHFRQPAPSCREVPRARPCLHHRSVAESARLPWTGKLVPAHCLKQPLSSPRLLLDHGCMDDRAIAHNIRSQAPTAHLAHPMLRSVQVVTLGACINQGIEREHSRGNVSLLHLLEPRLGPGSLTTTSTSIDHRVEGNHIGWDT